MGAELDEIFAPAGSLGRVLSGYEARPGQLDMARAVYESLDSGRHLVAEAGTGVGKSLAYLCAAGLWAARGRKKVVVATYTRALQEQLILKDLPAAAAALKTLGLPLSYALLMGSENYLCLDRLSRRAAQPELEPNRGIETLWTWAQGDPPSGLRSRLPASLADKDWERVNRDPALCPGRKGPFAQRCLYRKDVAAARRAQVLVVNQALLFAGMPVPSYDALIIDEAHNIEESAVRFLGLSLGEVQVKALLDEAAGPRGAVRQAFDPEWRARALAAAEACREAAQTFFRSLEAELGLDPGAHDSVSRRLREPKPVPNPLSAPLVRLAEILGSAPEAGLHQKLEWEALSERSLRAAAALAEFMSGESSGQACWAEGRRTRRGTKISLNRAPVDVGPSLRSGLFGAGRPVVLTSATLAAGGSFAHFRERVGLDDALEVLVPSPFDFKRQALLYAAEGMPDPKADPEAYERAVIAKCGELCALVPGGVFLLFTSKALMLRAHAELSGALDRPVFCQGEGGPYELLQAFRSAGNGVLFGTDTFWQGVDIAGSALSCVVITRLPFLYPDNPLEEARQERLAAMGENVFGGYALPKAVIKFRQGFGRLIRSQGDRGAVVVLDPRLLTRPYGSAFRSALPDSARASSIEEFAAFFRPAAREAAR